MAERARAVHRTCAKMNELAEALIVLDEAVKATLAATGTARAVQELGYPNPVEQQTSPP